MPVASLRVKTTVQSLIYTVSLFAPPYPASLQLTIDQYNPCKASDTHKYGMIGIKPPMK